VVPRAVPVPAPPPGVTDVLRRGEDGWRIVHHHSEALAS
jgi:hypothetical protein